MGSALIVLSDLYNLHFVSNVCFTRGTFQITCVKLIFGSTGGKTSRRETISLSARTRIHSTMIMARSKSSVNRQIFINGNVPADVLSSSVSQELSLATYRPALLILKISCTLNKIDCVMAVRVIDPLLDR